MAVEVLKSRGVPEERIIFLNLIASPEGVQNFASKFPKLHVVTAFIDQGLDERKYVLHPSISAASGFCADHDPSYIVPGLGDFGDRFYTM